MADIDALHLKYTELHKEDVIKEGDSTNLTPVKSNVEKIYEWERQYHDDTDYRRQLPEATRRGIEQEFENAINQFTQIVNLRNQDIAGFAQQKDTFINTITNYYRALYESFVRDYRGWMLDHQQSERAKQLDNILAEAQKSQKNIKKQETEIGQRAKAATEATQEIGLSELAKYFYQLVRGDNEGMMTGRKDNKWNRFWFRRVFPSVRGYQGAARIWLTLAVAAFYVAYRVADSQLLPFLKTLTPTPGQPSVSASVIYATLITKALVLVVPIYAIRFCLKNYGSNKHLAADALHKAKTLQTLQTYLAIPRDDKAATREIATTVAQLVFTPTESGFIANKGDYDPPITINTPSLKS